MLKLYTNTLAENNKRHSIIIVNFYIKCIIIKKVSVMINVFVF